MPGVSGVSRERSGNCRAKVLSTFSERFWAVALEFIELLEGRGVRTEKGSLSRFLYRYYR